MKAYFIDSENRTITETEIKNWQEISPKIGCELFTIVGMENSDSLYVDDEGLLKPQNNFFLYSEYPQPLAGNGIVLGTNDEGESVEPKISLDELKSKITFMNRAQAYIWAKENDV